MAGLTISRVSMKNQTKVSIPVNVWFDYPFGPGSECEDTLGWHSTTVHPERVTPNRSGDCLIMAKFNLRDILVIGTDPAAEFDRQTTQIATRFYRMKQTDKEPDITWTNELAAGGMTNGLWCHTANGPQKTMFVNQFWVVQICISTKIPGPPVVCETAELIFTGFHS